VGPKEFLEPGYKLAYSLLAKEGSFPPFGVGAGADGKPNCIMPEDGSPKTVKAKLREECESGRFSVVALFSEVEVRYEDRPSQRAVAVYLDTVGGPSRLIMTPFVIEEGQLQCGAPTIRDNPDPLLSPNEGQRTSARRKPWWRFWN